MTRWTLSRQWRIRKFPLGRRGMGKLSGTLPVLLSRCVASPGSSAPISRARELYFFVRPLGRVCNLGWHT